MSKCALLDSLLIMSKHSVQIIWGNLGVDLFKATPDFTGCYPIQQLPETGMPGLLGDADHRQLPYIADQPAQPSRDNAW